MSNLKFTLDHEWILVSGTSVRVGITNHAQEQLGDVVFVELPAIGAKLVKGQEAAVVESVKAASDLYAPVSGTVVAVNAALPDQPGLVNSDPLGEGWFFELTLSDATELEGLLDEAGYQTHIGA